MKKSSQPAKVIAFLEKRPNKKFTAKEIAAAIYEEHRADYEEKGKNSKFKEKSDLIRQIASEINPSKLAICKDAKEDAKRTFWQDKPRPRLFWYDPQKVREEENLFDARQPATEEETGVTKEVTTLDIDKPYTEQDLYPILMEYLDQELNLRCWRIDEKTSSNSKGPGVNKWLHPDIVAMQIVAQNWSDHVWNCAKNSGSGGQIIRLWSFEVKKELDKSNVRESFFQAVSNSSWANEGYLVATALSSNIVEKELRMLSALHGIGLIVLNLENPSESAIELPARARPNVDWQSVNRLMENKDF